MIALPMLLMTTALWADKPIHIGESTEVFWDLNPCTEEWHELTIYHDEYLHLHKNNIVWIDKRSGETSSGYYLTSGHAMFVGNENSTQIKDSINDTWVSGDGSVFKFYFMWVYDVELDEVRTAHFRFECLND